ncbi:MAG: hypothetical protein K0S14_571 [Thermomicrobiales bacterium]|nr:hypothetical protein [Thermomicrobiales bacterium]
MLRPAAHPLAARSFEVSGEDGHPVREPQQPGQTLVLGGCVAAAEIWSSDVPDQQRVAGEHHRRLGASLWIDNQDGNQLGSVARGVQHAQPQLPQRQFLAVMKRTERIRDLGRFVETQIAPVLGDETAGARDVVSVDMGVDRIAEVEAALREQCLVLFDRDRGVDDGGLVTLAGGNQVGGAATPFVEKLLEIHRHVLFGLSAAGYWL